MVLYSMLLLLAALPAVGQSPLSASVSTTRAAVNEVFHLTVAARGADVKEPDLGPLQATGLHIGTPSVQSSTSIQYINGQTTMVQSRTWRYPLSAAEEGTVVVPRLSAVIDGQEHFTQPIEIEITRGLDMGAESTGSRQETTVEDLVFVRAVTDKTTVFQGEPLILRLRLYVLDGNYVRVEAPRSLPMPDMEGFYPGAQWQDTRVEQHYGRTYRITEFSRVLFPAMPGELTIGAWDWQGAVRWHDVRRRMQTAARLFRTNAIPVTVLPLPDRPEGFGGAVGRFHIQAQLAGQALTQGTPVRYTVVISGEGNPNTISAPTLTEMPWAHVSGPETETRQQENSAEFTKTFSYLITPLDIGEHTVPPAAFVYFAPMIKNFKTEQTRAFDVVVEPSEDGGEFVAVGGSAAEQRSRIEVFDDGMLPLVTDAGALSKTARNPGARLSRIALVSPALPLLAFAALSAFLRRRDRLTRDRGYARRFYARGKCMKALQGAVHADDPTEALSLALKGYIADMLDINEAGLTSSEVEALLRERQVPEDTVALAVRVLRACERARYAGRVSAVDEVEALRAASLSAVEGLQGALQEKRS